MRSRKALVTGGLGFIGSSLTLKLRELGWYVDVVDNLTTGRQEFIEDLTNVGSHVFVEDYGDDWCLSRVRDGRYDVVFHVGAVPRVAYSVENPAETEHNNVYMTLRLLEACRDNVDRVVFSSSSSVIGSNPDVEYPSHERYERRPLSPYAQQKSSIEDYCRMFFDLYGLDSVCLRYFNVYGPRQFGDSPYSTVISAWCQALYDGRPCRLDGDGGQSRDFAYIDNVVDANVRAANVDDRLCGMPINIAHGEEHSVNDVLTLFKDRFGPRMEIVNAPPRAGDVRRTWADISVAQQVLGYEPTVNFTLGLQRTWEWWGL